MKHNFLAPANHSSTTRRSTGAALVVVLGMLVLVLVLVVAFLSSVSVELQSAKKYSGGADARALADSAVSLVISQIQDATAGFGKNAGGGPDSSNPLAWASQPGMIRTYNNQGYPETAYKLYSSGQMRVTGSYNPAASQSVEVPPNWSSDPSLFVDLNKPVAVSGTLRYPILNPAAVARDASGGQALSGSSPIEGCFLDSSSPALATGSQPNPVPMPVKWIYVLRNGALTAPASAAEGTAIFSGPNTPSKDNPIVGRIAFWTDDETSKVNINTASEGCFWDRPWASGGATGFETRLTQTIPAQNEFQRFPGHPAMTSLSVVFPPRGGESEIQYNARIYGIVPRIQDGGSKSGSVTVNYLTPPIVPDNDRLFASVDEFFFSAANSSSGTRGVNPNGPGSTFSVEDIDKSRFFLTANSRSPEVNLFNKPRVALWPLQIDPEPETGRTTQTAKDKLIAFCSTIGSGASALPYYFQRYNTFDFSKGGPNDRGSGNYNPAQNPRPSSQSPTMDWTNIPRNRDLYAYLQSLTDKPIPGLGGTLAGGSGKYSPTNRDQILTEMFDFLRSHINVTTAGIKTVSGATGYSYAPFNPANLQSWPGQFQIVPLVLPNNTKGFGNFGTITQAALVFFRTDNILVSGTEQKVPKQVYKPVVSTSAITSGTTPTMRAALILQPFTPSPGPPPWSANLRIRVEGLNQFAVTSGTNSLSLGFPDDATNLVNARDAQSNATATTGLELFTQYWPLRVKQPGVPVVGAADEETFYPFVSNIVPVSGSTFNFTGGTITIKLYSGYASSLNEDDLVQTITMRFPNGSGWPVPRIAFSRSVDDNKTPSDTSDDSSPVVQYNLLTTRFGSLQTGGYGIQQDGQHNPLPLIWPDDTVRAVETRWGGPARGDYRAIAALREVPDTFFEGHGLKDVPTEDGKSYADTATTSRLIHSLRVDSIGGQLMSSFSGGYYNGAGRAGKLVENAPYYVATGNPQKGQRAPDAVRGLAKAEMPGGILGDWDNGLGNRRDGPFINKADLGNVGSNAEVTNGYFSAPGLDRSASNAVLVDTGASYSPNRQISSAIGFGSLPSGIDPANPGATVPWKTLLFCKNPGGGSQHPGFGKPLAGGKGPPYSQPPDHAFLDFFTMPIVEPYAISEPFSTAGKVNMNYQIVPFTYLTRDTGVRAVLKSTRMMAIPTSSASNYKYLASSNQIGASPPGNFRYTLDADETNGTLAGFKKRFDSGDIFRSASEICDIYLVPGRNVDGSAAPGNPAYDSMESWWGPYALTGDNAREQPYAHIYPRLTTKSNSFTVHVIAQSITKSNGTPANQFVESRDQVTGEFRGSFLIERYLDPNSDSLVPASGNLAEGEAPPDEKDPAAMVGPYKFRVVSSKRFAP